MEIEKLIERLESWNEQHLSVVCGNGHFACDYLCENEDCIVVRAATAFSTLQAENEKLKAQVPRWIPVEERLPEEEGLYIVCVDGEVKWDAYCMFEGVERWLCYDGRLNALYIDPYSSKLTREPPYPRVTHWMPLPAVPKEVKE